MENTQKWFEFVKGVSAVINEIIDDTKDLGPSFKESGLFEMINTSQLIYRTEGVTGLGYLESFSEDGTIKEDETYAQYQTEYTAQDKGKIVSFSQKLMKTRPEDLAAKLDEVKQTRIAADRTLDKYAWQCFVDAFTTTDSESDLPIMRLDDAVSMISTAHTSKVSGVANRSNRLASNPVLSETNLFTAIKTIEEQLNGRGLPINYRGDYTLLVPPALRKSAIEITGSDMRSGTANNDLNYFKGGIMDVISSTYLGSANGGSETAWYVVAKNAPNMPLKYVSLIEPKIEQNTNFRTKSHEVSIDMSNSFGYSNWEFIAGSDGTAS